MKNKALAVFSTFLLSVPVFIGGASLKDSHYEVSEAASSTYYSSIGDYDTGTTLLNKLRTLNNQKRPKENLINYNSMWSYFPNTDPYYSSSDGSSVKSFYNGERVTRGRYTREHIWPYSRLVLNDSTGNSRGDNDIEKDLYEIRPCSSSVNEGRGNAFYGLTEESASLYDPGQYNVASYRGDAARIIFYCVVADSGLSLVDSANDYSSNHTMGKLSTLLKWNLEYSPTTSETKRNNAVESVQGHRNPFVDHPEYACRIWGNYSNDCRDVCKSQGFEKTLDTKINGVSTTKTSISIDRYVDVASYVNNTLTSSGITCEAVSGDTPTTTNVVQIANNGASIRVTGKTNGTCRLRFGYTYQLSGGGSETIYRYLNVEVTDKVVVTRIRMSMTPFVTEFYVGDTFTHEGLEVTADFSDGSKIDNVAEDCVYSNTTLDTEGEREIRVSYTYDGVTVEMFYTINVLPKKASAKGCGGNIVTTSVTLMVLSLVGIGATLIVTIRRKKKAKQ